MCFRIKRFSDPPGLLSSSSFLGGGTMTVQTQSTTNRFIILAVEDASSSLVEVRYSCDKFLDGSMLTSNSRCNRTNLTFLSRSSHIIPTRTDRQTILGADTAYTCPVVDGGIAECYYIVDQFNMIPLNWSNFFLRFRTKRILKFFFFMGLIGISPIMR